MRSFALVLCLVLPIPFQTQVSAADEAIALPAIVKEGTPADALDSDPVVPSARDTVRHDSGKGSVLGSIEDTVPLPVSERGAPGALSQFRGFGKSAEDTNVQALGIPLNSPQGGGFDLSIFPQYLWSSYEFQAGPSLGAFDPRGVAGSLYLTPWTAAALGSHEPGWSAAGWARVTELVSSDGLNQVSAAGRGTEAGIPVAALAGYSSGKAKGPSGSLSAQASLGGDSKISAHFLGTDLDAETPGPGGISPLAHQQSTRLIPVAQLDLPVGSSALLKSSAYYDWSVIRYEDSPGGFATHDRIQQEGVENALLWSDWRIGLSARRTAYEQVDFEPPTEDVLNVQVTRSFELGSFLIEPTARAVWVSAHGIGPEASLGAKEGLGGGASVYARATYSRRLPSLQDRYYVLPPMFGGKGFEGNPDLESERDYTAILGGAYETRAVEASLQLFGQWRDNGQVLTSKDASFDTLVNAGSASLLSAVGTVTLKPYEWLDLSTSLTLSDSNISVPGGPDQDYFYFPAFIDVTSLVAHARGDRPLWTAGIWARFASSALATSTGDRVPGYGYFDFRASLRLGSHLYVSGIIENFLDRPVQVLKDYPLQRIFAAQLVGEM